MKAVVVAHGEVHPSDRAALAGAQLIVAADGGSDALDRWGMLPTVVVGDLDSLDGARAAEYRARGVTVIAAPTDKDESDLELALRVAIDRGAKEVVLLGTFGGARLDYTIANTLLIADDRYRGVSLRAIRGGTTVRPLHASGRLDLSGTVGDTVTLLPVRGDAVGVTTAGLRYALRGGTLRFGPSRGVSNVITALPASVSLDSGILLVVEMRAEQRTQSSGVR